MDTSKLKKFAQYARRSLIEQVQSKLRLVLAQDSAARREYPHAVKELEAKQKEFGDDKLLIEQVAYTWFNRFCALRFMDANQYNRIMVVSPIAGQFQPEILAEAKAGHLDESVFDAKTSGKIRGLLSGTIPSRDGQAEAYRLIIVGVCNDYHRLMPYLFERIEDYTELLMPEDLLSGNSILAYTREAMTPENCESVESIGWLYQFYISEKKDQVFEGLKKNKKITPENIPAATQLFTPHWIVKYLVENSLGRLWMLNNPSSKVIEQMDYYIKPVEEENDFLKISTPEELKICDPAAGSGHMLTYAYDLLYAIYLDANYDPADIPELILTKNLYGIEIDERAAELAAFALSMKAMKGNPFDDSNNRRRFFRNPIKPNICRLEKVKINDADLEEYIEFAGKELFTADVRATLKEFEEADNFGSLIQPTLKNAEDVRAVLEAKDVSGQLFLTEIHKRVLRLVGQADYLSQKYHVVVANPPYMGTAAMNPSLKKFIGKNYPKSKPDVGATFIERNVKLVLESGYASQIVMQGWMFLSRYEDLRRSILHDTEIISLAHLGERAFDSIGGAVVSTAAFVLRNRKPKSNIGAFIRLTEGRSEAEKSQVLLDVSKGVSKALYFRRQNDFERIPTGPISYWLTEETLRRFSDSPSFGTLLDPRKGLVTANNEKYVRFHWEVSRNKLGRSFANREEAKFSGLKWFPYNKGGERRKWSGNDLFVVDWFDDGREMQTTKHPTDNRIWATNFNLEYIFKKGLTWSDITTDGLVTRIMPEGFLFDDTGKSAFLHKNSSISLEYAASVTNTKVGDYISQVLNPTLHFLSGDFARFPCVIINESEIEERAKRAIQISDEDWKSSEIAPEFTECALLSANHRDETLKGSYCNLRLYWRKMTNEMQTLEEHNNHLFINAYGLQEELSPEVAIEEITLTCNPSYQYGAQGTDESNETRLLADSIAEFISYSVGCMFGRFSLAVPGMIIASQGEQIDNYYAKVAETSFMPDEDNVIPVIDFEGDWFEDDISERFKEFLKVTFGEENFAENLAFIEDAIGKDIKKYFLKDFYADHVKRYKKRPIYWMFSSPKGSFNALIYMHRYQPDTVSIVLNDYLREFRTKLEARKESYEQVEISASASQKDKTNAIKAISKINKVLEEINDYEHDVLYPLAGEKIEIDLDDGVKHNYPLFGKALKKVTGLS
ncbi:BREX-1 system adenine-specific DNA-methyltransferase PglX [Pseudoalteromonas sp. HF66]|uniref:BREX-1 system adenine-specific DNA-methyltransferase PglX n=1 Tax=Pseudoalteromonas sp. HF66 TaxID=2721559 RepID=UPI0014315390|nr:BREX-1 system adenine-specific DNA-methyltransferase PglX [Pseudoalteromonas sp. HF66]NIZ05475.1 BREX-1 system adenine-specific DNA-methyltransferase PglX [Pseudoalteromonas sp. HF66]